MRYNTIVDKSEGGLEGIISAVEQFEENRFLAGLQVRRHTMYDIQQASLMVREYQQKMNREVLALSRFSETFIQEYATDNNECALPLAHEFADHNTLGIRQRMEVAAILCARHAAKESLVKIGLVQPVDGDSLQRLLGLHVVGHGEQGDADIAAVADVEVKVHVETGGAMLHLHIARLHLWMVIRRAKLSWKYISIAFGVSR